MNPHLLSAIVIGSLTASAWAQEAASPPAAAGTRRALIVCGLTGDAPHRLLLADTTEKLYAGLTGNHGFAAENIVVVWGEPPNDKDGPAVKSSRGPATREALTEAVANLEKSLQPEDTLWLFVLGHAHYDGRYSWLNLPGPDMQQIELGKLLANLKCRQQVFFLTTSASGFFLKPLAQNGRIVITATEPDLEVNETVFPHKLAMALSAPPPYEEFDVDRDGRMTLLDLYLWTAKATAQDYMMSEFLATEHAQIDDVGDGRGAELQAAFLPEDLGGKLPAGKDPPLIKTGKGVAARKIWLPAPLAPPIPEPEPPPATPPASGADTTRPESGS
jgi:hypothetical protein